MQNEIKAKKCVNEYPIGTKYPSTLGGYWEKVGDSFFKWHNGDIFTNVGGDWNRNVILPEITFLQPCYIIKNSKELWDKLEELGYIKDEDNCYLDEDILYVNRGHYGTTFEMNEIPYKSQQVYCGDNEELFLAVAALREDTDYKQYFVNETYQELIPRLGYFIGKGSFSYCLINEYKPLIERSKFHKASVEELINYFNKKEENETDGTEWICC